MKGSFGKLRTWAWIIGIAAILVVFLFPVLPPPADVRDQRWFTESAVFLKRTGLALEQYSKEHQGKLPSRLADLYPKYFQDECILHPVAEFVGKPIAIVYYGPRTWGDPKIAIASIRLDPSIETKYRWRGSVLWGNGAVLAER